VCEKEKIDFDAESVNLLARLSSGDIRSALLDLQTICWQSKKLTLSDVESLGSRERSDKIFSVVQKIFRSRTVSECGSARGSSDADPDFLLRWIEENVPLEFSDLSERADAFSRLSRSDVFSGRIRIRQHYGFLKYSLELMSTGVALCHRVPARQFIMYKFPGLLRLLSANAAVRAMQKSLGKSAGKKLHLSSRGFASRDLPFWRQMFENHAVAVALSAKFRLSAEEIAFVMRSDVKSKTVADIAAKSAALAQAALAHSVQHPVRQDPVQTDAESSGNLSDEPVSHRQTRLF